MGQGGSGPGRQQPAPPAEDALLDHLVAGARRRRRLADVPALFAQTASLVWRAGPWLLALTVCVTVAVTLLAIAQVFLVRDVLEVFVAARRDPGYVWSAWPALAQLAGITAALMASSSVTALLQRQLNSATQAGVLERVLSVTTRVPLEAYETPAFVDQLQRVRVNAATRPIMMVNHMLSLTAGVLGVAGMSFSLLALAPQLLPVLILAALPLFVAGRLSGRMEFAFAVAQASPGRERNYLESVLVSRDTAKEVRAFGLEGHLMQRWAVSWRRYLADQLRLVIARIGMDLAAVALSALAGFAAVLLLLYLIAHGRITVADAGTAALAMRVLSARAQSLTGGVGGLFEARLFLEDLNAFLQTGVLLNPEEEGEPAKRLPREIVVDDLTFLYPASARPSLRNVNMRFRRGEVIAIVGENGSGKTTLAKLLAGLYRPTGGRILWDGRDLTRLNQDSVRNLVAVLFQDFARYQLSADDNVSFGRPGDEPDPAAVRNAASRAGIDDYLSALPRGYQTTLSKLFDGGTDLSLGQWQRVALARAFYRDAPLVILDEPTAALDPRAERELFEDVRRLLAGRTVVLISHRFATVRSADRIYVMDRGRVIEEGTHEQLLAGGGRYAELFELQASFMLGEPVTNR